MKRSAKGARIEAPRCVGSGEGYPSPSGGGGRAPSQDFLSDNGACWALVFNVSISRVKQS